MIWTFEVTLSDGQVLVLQVLADDEQTALEYLSLQLESMEVL